jgi:hypothetical protein
MKRVKSCIKSTLSKKNSRRETSKATGLIALEVPPLKFSNLLEENSGKAARSLSSLGNSGKEGFLLISDLSRVSGHSKISRLKTFTANPLRLKTEIAFCLLIRTVKKISRTTFQLPTNFPLLIEKTLFIALTCVTVSDNQLTNLVKPLTTYL